MVYESPRAQVRPHVYLNFFFLSQEPPLKSNPVSLRLCVEKLSIVPLLSSGRYIKNLNWLISGYRAISVLARQLTTSEVS